MKKRKAYTFAKPTPKPKRVIRRAEPKPKPGRAYTFAVPSKAMPPSGHGWHHDGAERDGNRWTCDYNCKSFVWTSHPKPGQYHAWDCPYWANEGKHLTPFD